MDMDYNEDMVDVISTSKATAYKMIGAVGTTGSRDFFTKELIKYSKELLTCIIIQRQKLLARGNKKNVKPLFTPPTT